MLSGRMLFKAAFVYVAFPFSVYASDAGIAAIPAPSLEAVLWVQQAESESETLGYKNALASIYEQMRYSIIWSDYRSKDELETQINIISLAGISQGFEWRANELRDLRASGDWRSYDLLATDSLLALISYIEQIPEHGKSWFFGTDITESLPTPQAMKIQNIIVAASTGRLYDFVFDMRPQTPQYREMAKAIVNLQDTDSSFWPIISQKGLIREGDTLENPAHVISSLQRHRVLSEEDLQRLRIDKVGYYHPVLVKAVRQFQALHGLNADGVIGNRTLRWLNKSADTRIQILALNMERLRLWPTERDGIILVNIPSYEMELWINKELVLDSRVVVGRPSRRTPLFDSQLDSVVFNPSWNVPVTIMRKDILPKVKEDSEYLVKHNYTVLNSWVDAQVIPYEQIDWENVTPRNFPYRLQQSPGDSNALGRYKFNTPNGNAIYLHDTPAKNLFAKERRAYSSGCIRVQRAEDLAALLLNRSGFDINDYKYYQQTPETKWVSLRERLAVHTIYQTAWVNSEGDVEYRDDVYHYDARPKRLNSVSLTANN